MAFLNDKVSVQQDNITCVNTCIPNVRASKYVANIDR